MTLPADLALASLTAAVLKRELSRSEDGLRQQVIRTFAPPRDVTAAIDAFETLAGVPFGDRPVVLAEAGGPPRSTGRDPATGTWVQGLADRGAQPPGRSEGTRACPCRWTDRRREQPQLDHGVGENDPSLGAERAEEREAHGARSMAAAGWQRRMGALLPDLEPGMP